MTLCCLPEDRLRHHMELVNTCTGQVQPGAFFIKWVIKKRVLRSTQESDTIASCFERYGDAVSYNVCTHINEIVAETKQSNEDPTTTTAEAQHNEQMIGLWVPNQQAMLGLEFYTEWKSLIGIERSASLYSYSSQSYVQLCMPFATD